MCTNMCNTVAALTECPKVCTIQLQQLRLYCHKGEFVSKPGRTRNKGLNTKHIIPVSYFSSSLAHLCNGRLFKPPSRLAILNNYKHLCFPTSYELIGFNHTDTFTATADLLRRRNLGEPYRNHNGENAKQSWEVGFEVVKGRQKVLTSRPPCPIL